MKEGLMLAVVGLAVLSGLLLLNAVLSFREKAPPVLSWIRLEVAALVLLATGVVLTWIAQL